MKKLAKVLSILLAVALAVTGFMLAVSADDAKSEVASYTVNGETVTGTLVEALSAADEYSTVKLEGDCTLAQTFTVTKSVTVDLNGYTLTAKADAFVIGANDVQFDIVGTGSIALAGKLVSADKEFTGFMVNVAGNEKTEGISIAHTSSNITTTYHGLWNFKNLKVVSTSVLLQGDAYFKTERDTSATATLVFNAVSFDSTAVPYQKSTGNFVVSIAGEGNVYVENSAFRTQNSGIYAAHGKGETAIPVSGMISIVNSTISCLASQTYSGRVYVVLGQDHLFTSGIDSNTYGFNGILLVENSTVECNTRMFTFGSSDAPSIYITDSTLRIAGNSGTDNSAYGFVRGAGEVNLSGNIRWISVEQKLSNAPIGTRTNLAAMVNGVSGTKVVYDPIGDSVLPFVVVSEDSDVASPDFYRDYNFDAIRLHDDNGGNRDININNKNQSWVHSDTDDRSGKNNTWTKDPFWFQDKTKGMQWDNKYGTITHVLSEGSSYVKYWIQPDGSGKSTVKLNSGNKTDTYFVMGLGLDGDYTNSGYHPTAMSGANRKSVVVAEFDFATEAGGIGYPYMQVLPQVRDTANGGATHAKSFTINNAGNIVDTGRLQNKPEVMPTLNPAGEWNRLAAVCYSDPANAQYLVYFYLNGELMGYDTLYNPDKTSEYFYFQGIRLSFANDNQKVNANLLIDNVSIRAYTDYKFAGEKDSDFDAETGTYAMNGVYYPEKYISGAPAKAYVNPYVTVGGLAFGDINDALAYANENNLVVDINKDLKLDVKTNGIINTNGHKITLTDDSYGYMTSGNLLEFNENYQYEAWFYTGSLDALNNGTFTDADFEKAVVKMGDYVNKDLIYTAETTKNYTDKTITGGQSGWGYTKNDTDSVLPKNVDLADITLAGEAKVIKYFPIMGSIPMTYYVTDKDGNVYAGDITSEQALVDFRALKDGDTFVLQSNVNITEAENTFVNKGTINIDLNGNTLSLSKAGRFVVVGSYTTLNVYSSVEGGAVNCATYTNGAIKGNQAFVIDDASVTSFTSPDLANNVKSAKINIGGNGVKMTVIAEVALKARVGDDDCRIVSDGVDYISPDNAINRSVFDAQLYNGEIYVKNSFILAINKFNIVNVDGFYLSSDLKDAAGNVIAKGHAPEKDADGNEIELSHRQPGFENTVMTGYMELENCIIVNRLSGLNNDDIKDNIVANNGDGNNSRKNIKFMNVVSTGRLNPSNSQRTNVEGFLAVEHYDISAKNGTYLNGTAKHNYLRPMTLDMIDLGIETVDGVYTCTLQYYDAELGTMVTFDEYKLSSGKTVEGAYTLPYLKGAAAYEKDIFEVSYMNIAGDSVIATDNYVKGSMLTLKSGLNVPAYTGKLVTLTHTGIWHMNSESEYITENITLTPEYTASMALTGVMANLSLYSDFDVNLYIPAEYMDVITIEEAYALADATLNDKAYKVITVTQACNNITANITVTINMSETVLGVEYTDTKVINYSVAKYAETALASESMDNSTKVLVYYMLNYANEAAKYLNGEANETLTAMIEANKRLPEMNPHTPGNDPLVTPDAVAKLGSVFTQATLTLDPKPAYVFTVKAGFVGTVTVANGNNVRTYNFTENTDRTIVIDGMKAYNFVATLVITAEGTVNGETVTLTDGVYNLAAFAEYHASNSENADSAACLPLVNAFRSYADYAYFYKMGVWAW